MQRLHLRQHLRIVTKCDILLLSAQFPQRRVKHYDTTPAYINASVDQSLQRIGVEYGFRIADSAAFMQAVKPTGLAVEERITQVIDPPSFEIMAEMIDTVAKEMAQ